MKIGMLFPGYSSQFVGMGKEFYDDFRIIQEYFEEAYNCLNINFIKLCFASSDNELSKISNAYTSIFLISASLSELLKENGIKADVVSGFGIGSFAGIFCTGALTFPDSLYLVKKFANFYEDSINNMDVEILNVQGISALKLKKICQNYESIEISIFKDFENFISGKSNDIHAVKKELDNLKIKAKKIDPAFGLNSNLMDIVTDQLKIYLEKVDFKDSNIPFISSIDTKEILIGKKFKQYIIKHIQSPIKWNKVVSKFANVDLIITVGPGDTLSDYIKSILPEKQVITLEKKSDLEYIKSIISVDSNKGTEKNVE